MASGFLKRGMSYFGLIDEGYEEDDLPLPDAHPESPLAVEDPWDQDRTSSVTLVETVDPVGPVGPVDAADPVDPVDRDRSSTVSLFTPRVKRVKSAELSPQVHSVAPEEFADARFIADSVMAGQPVIVNLQTASRELKRRMIDFCSGVTYGLGGGMERVAANVFLITPSDVELSAEERKSG